eukprot:EC723653.1.p1 GENE.EC723653.1~~EC723653.1.p1  ORF type:complete len:188 (+),score=23.72 EC723653.1:99-662(+)
MFRAALRILRLVTTVVPVQQRATRFMGAKSTKSSPEIEALKSKLTPYQYHITQEKGTERAFTGRYWDCHDQGIYHCVVCDTPLFSSEKKFESGTGWPSFTAPAAGDAVAEVNDLSHGMVRSEATCARCGAHLGHVFNDGPRDAGGLRYCINSASLQLRKQQQEQEQEKHEAEAVGQQQSKGHEQEQK